jgi:hypothetical protein
LHPTILARASVTNAWHVSHKVTNSMPPFFAHLQHTFFWIQFIRMICDECAYMWAYDDMQKNVVFTRSAKKRTRYSVESRLSLKLHFVMLPTPSTHIVVVLVKKNLRKIGFVKGTKAWTQCYQNLQT